ncbi:MAG: sulfite exporter TauE/SafE family protein [Bacteroidetes bacterium]|nr:sulfite exporter TauE/SafE family protein [Bacteroidota bacterium]MCB9043467.1 sulfite exporter TauE/SafE family protein [Chitinophagales bacterium]
MFMNEFLGYVGAVVMGIVLGLIGGGGSILTVPILVYILHINPILATAYSLFIVGSTALVGAVRNMQKNLVDFRTAIIFAIPAFIAVYLTRRYLMPNIPEIIWQTGSFTLTKEVAIMVFFAIIMLLSAISMIRNKRDSSSEDSVIQYNYPLIIAEGLLVGVVTGIVGAGGGFLIIPALVLLAKLPMKKAVGTSLLIIAAKSLIGFLGDVQNLAIDWKFLSSFTIFAMIGILIGIWLSGFIDGNKLKKSFGWFVLIMGCYIIAKELFLK